MYREKNIKIEDIKYILDNIRDEDRLEAESTLGKDWKKSLLSDLLNSNQKFILAKTKTNKIPVLIAGAWAVGNNNSIGAIWMLSTPEIVNHQISFLKEMKKELKKYDEDFSILYNKLYKENKLAKNWLKWAGFRFPQSEKKHNALDKAFLSVKIPSDFEIFYRERIVKGLGE